MSDYYNILGVDEKSDIKEIKKAYRELSLKWHPDKNKDPEAINKIQLINQAYATLGDEEKRRQYDEQRKNPQCFQQQFYQQPCHQGFPSGFSFSTNFPESFFSNNDTFAKEMQQNLRDQLSQAFFKGFNTSFPSTPNAFSEYKVQTKNGTFVTSFRMSTSNSSNV